MKSGNSATLRIPSEILKQLELSIGDEVVMSTTDKSMCFEKVTLPRAGWFDNISPECAAIEAKLMENDFSNAHNDGLDDWTLGEEW